MKKVQIKFIRKNEEGKTDLIEFFSPINRDSSHGATNLSEKTRSTMELFHNTGSSMIEWDIEELEITEHIGLWFKGKELVEYDGVFELPIQAIKMLRQLGYKVPKDFESN